MDSAPLVTQAGKDLSVVKFLLTSVQWLWVYDYLLTLGDEIQYAWPARKSWVFALFIGNRYTPVVNFIWAHITMFSDNNSFCEKSKWIPAFNAGAGTVFAHMAIALRIYAITSKNKWLGYGLASVIAVEIGGATFFAIWAGLGPSIVPTLLDINADVFRVCVFKLWKGGILIYYMTTMFFDVLAFSIVVFTAKKSRRGLPRLPSILDSIVRDATLYFVLIFSAHLLSLLFLFSTPENIQLLPAMVNATFVPLMASRLMLSLKKAAAKTSQAWSLQSMTNSTRGRTSAGGTLRFASQVPGRPHGISLAPMVLDAEMELDTVSPLSQSPVYPHLHIIP